MHKNEQKGNLAEQMVDNDSDSEQKYCRVLCLLGSPVPNVNIK